MLKLFFRHFISVVTLSAILNAFESPFSLSQQVQKVIPSIVKIKVQRTENINEDSDLISIDAGGSGFVLDAYHHIVTNAHVIGDAKKIIIIDHTNTEYPAVLIGKDDKTDIALLEASSFNAPNLSLEETHSLAAGDGVFIIGAPYSLGYSVSSGIVSALNRFLPNYPYLTFIQTDAAINPGNSGGPMFNLDGRVIGMASTHFSRQGGYTNIGFAIPIEEVNRIAKQLILNPTIERGYLGAELLISEKISRKLGYRSAVMVTRIDPNSPAEKVGLLSGDLIIGINGEKLHDGGELHRFLAASRPESTANISYIRNKQEVAAAIRLEKTPKQKKEQTNIGSGDQAEKLGLLLRENDEGIEVITSYAIAKTLGIDAKDSIRRLNGNSVNTIKEFNGQLANIKENDIALVSIKRNENLIVVPLGTKTTVKGYSTQN